MLCAVGSIEGFKILLLIPFPGPSHFLMFKVFIKELVDRGHEVTAITAFPYNEPLKNYTEIKIETVWSFGDGCEFLRLKSHLSDKKLSRFFSPYQSVRRRFSICSSTTSSRCFCLIGGWGWKALNMR